MRFTTTVAALLTVTVGFVAAQSPTGGASSGKSSCAAQNILDACLTSTTPQLKACPPNDWKCLCEQANNVLTCYNNCPGDVNQFGASQTKESYCNAAKAYSPSSTTTGTSSATSFVAEVSESASASASSATGSATKTGSSPVHSGSSSSSSGSSDKAVSSTGAATPMVVQTGSLWAAVALALGVAL